MKYVFYMNQTKIDYYVKALSHKFYYYFLKIKILAEVQQLEFSVKSESLWFLHNDSRGIQISMKPYELLVHFNEISMDFATFSFSVYFHTFCTFQHFLLFLALLVLFSTFALFSTFCSLSTPWCICLWNQWYCYGLRPRVWHQQAQFMIEQRL